MRILNGWELQYARAQEHQVIIGQTLPAILQQLATDPDIYFAVLMPQHARLMGGGGLTLMRIRHPMPRFEDWLAGDGGFRPALHQGTPTRSPRRGP